MTQYTIDDASKGQGPANQHREILCSLIAAIGKHAVDETGDELERYRHRLGAEAAGLSDDSGIGGEQTAVKGVIRVMAEHNEAVKADYRLRTSELGRALRIMVETIGDVSTSSQAAVHQLNVIEKNLEEATAGPDAARFRSKLEVCVKMIREHSQILRTQTENQVNQLKSFVASRAPGLSSMVEFEAPLDQVTGLPTRSFAENLINERMARGSDCLVGVVALDRYHSLLGSFGPDVMDDLVKTVASDLAQRLPDGTTLCRWSPNSFIAISEIVSSFAETSQQWRKVRGLKLEKQIETKSKTALVLLTTAFMVEHLRPVSSKRAFIQGVEKFAQQHGDAPTGK